MSDCVLGLCGKDFALLAADASASFSIILMKNSEDKILKMDDNKLLAACGESGDRVQFSEYIQVCFYDCILYYIENKVPTVITN
jgi:20S proteasome subunit beta 4